MNDYLINLEDVQRMNISPSESSYINQYGFIVPRVTEIVSSTHGNEFMSWANYIGLKGIKYDKYMEQAADVGTEAHAAIELFLKDRVMDETSIPLAGFLMWFNSIKLPVHSVLYEHSLVCDYFGGTLDTLYQIGDKLFLVDYKTSENISIHHFIQLSAYRYMLKHVMNTSIDGMVILQLAKHKPGFNEFILDFAEERHRRYADYLEKAFFAAYNTYMNRRIIQNEFESTVIHLGTKKGE